MRRDLEPGWITTALSVMHGSTCLSSSCDSSICLKHKQCCPFCRASMCALLRSFEQHQNGSDRESLKFMAGLQKRQMTQKHASSSSAACGCLDLSRLCSGLMHAAPPKPHLCIRLEDLPLPGGASVSSYCKFPRVLGVDFRHCGIRRCMRPAFNVV